MNLLWIAFKCWIHKSLSNTRASPIISVSRQCFQRPKGHSLAWSCAVQSSEVGAFALPFAGIDMFHLFRRNCKSELIIIIFLLFYASLLAILPSIDHPYEWLLMKVAQLPTGADIALHVTTCLVRLPRNFMDLGWINSVANRRMTCRRCGRSR